MKSKRLLARLQSDERGALLPLFLFIMLFLLWAAVGILNVGQDTRDKMEAQNAIDAVSIAVADQAARDLNVMAMTQVASTQSFTIALSSTALQQALIQTMARTGMATVESITRCTVMGKWPAGTLYCIGYMVRMAAYAVQTIGIQSRYQPNRGISVGNRLTDALGRMSRHIVETHPARTGELGRIVGTANGLEAVFVYPACDRSNGSRCDFDDRFPGGSLPVEPAPLASGANGLAAYWEMCRAIDSGSDGYTRLDYSQHGFSNGLGPLTQGGSSANPKLRDHINRASGLSSLIPGFYRTMQSAFLIRYTPLSKHSSTQSSNSNEFLDTFDAAWAIGCPGVDSASVFSGAVSRSPLAASVAAVAQLAATRPTTYWLKGRGPAGVISSAIGALGPFANAAMSVFEPFSPLYLGAKTQGERSNREAFGFDSDPFYAYAQSMVFNEASHDLYTGRWNANIVPSFRMADPRSVGQALGRERAAPAFEKLRRLLMEAGNGGQWSDVNTH